MNGSFLIMPMLLMLAILIFADAMEKDQVNYQAEGACLNKLIVTGVERKDILTKDGICYRKVN